MRDNEQRRPEAEADGIIEGRNAVIEALRAGTTMDKIYLAKGETDKTLGHIASKARAQGIVVVEADRRKLDGMSPCWWCATRFPTPTIWGPSSAPPSAPEPTGSSSPSAAAPV